MEQLDKISPVSPEHILVDRKYRDHNYEGGIEIHSDKHSMGKTQKRLWIWMKLRAAVEPSIGHLKHGHPLDRNRLKGEKGDKINAVMSAVGMKFFELPRHVKAGFSRGCFINLNTYKDESSNL
jgi:IS5 family transposase